MYVFLHGLLLLFDLPEADLGRRQPLVLDRVGILDIENLVR